MRPRVQYAKSNEVNIAFQVVGDGPMDVIYVPGWVSNIDYYWTSPRIVHFIERLSSFARLILFDKRGTGLSDRNVGFPTLENRMEDVHAVLDAVGSRRAVLLGTSEGGHMCILFAATYPERTAALVLHGCYAKGVWAADHPWARTREEIEEELAAVEREWGGPSDLNNAAPSLAKDENEREWFATFLRNSASRQDAISLWHLSLDVDVRDILPGIHVPTLILHRTGDRWVKIEEARYLADRIEGAKFVEMTGDDHLIWTEDTDRAVDEIEEFLTGVRPSPTSQRVLLTVLFTDIVGSTALAADVGDHRWKELLKRHNNAIRTELQRYGGSEIKTTGDGFLAAFQGPTSAIQCANAVREQLVGLGLKVRAALHTGECERQGKDLSGIAVHIASRLLGHAHDGEIVVSRTTKDLVVGSRFVFEERGEVILSDIPGKWQLYAVGTAPG